MFAMICRSGRRSPLSINVRCKDRRLSLVDGVHPSDKGLAGACRPASRNRECPLSRSCAFVLHACTHLIDSAPVFADQWEVQGRCTHAAHQPAGTSPAVTSNASHSQRSSHHDNGKKKEWGTESLVLKVIRGFRSHLSSALSERKRALSSRRLHQLYAQGEKQKKLSKQKKEDIQPHRTGATRRMSCFFGLFRAEISVYTSCREPAPALPCS